ncbi:hypothetical protein V1502_18840 [Bacillus sp. SCS-153A]|uniref:hypothetical protein n=1 Tax=Rossellomorea sedimentorum TaxID=3115294 RepID=UPI003905F4A5
MTAMFHFLLLFLSLGGLGLAIHQRLKIHSAFIPIFLYSAITFILFIAGILNVLPLAVKIIYYTGLLVWPVFLYMYLKRKYTFYVKDLFSPAILFFASATAIFMFWLEGVYFTHYDNFSHWALIVKEMYLRDGLPDDSTVISFRNYPPGTAVFIYFILEIAGYAESYAIMAQNFLMAASLAVLFVYTTWKKPAYILLTLLIVIGLVSLEMYSIYNLIVDKVLGMVAFTSVIIAYFYRKDWKKNLLVNVPVLVLLILIKDSGKLFFAFNALLILGLIIRNEVTRRKVSLEKGKFLGKVSAILFGIPLIVNYLWLKYTEKSYTASYEDNKFAVTGSKVTSPNKSEGFVETLFPKMMERLINLDTHIFLIFTVTNAALIISFIVFWLVNKKASKLLFYAFLFCNMTFVAYIGSLYLMYLFLMPENEAARLASYYRYLTTIVIYIGAIGLGAALLEWSKLSNKGLKTGLAVLLAILIYYPTYEKVEAVAGKPDINDSIRLKVKPAVKKIIDTDHNNPDILYYSPESDGDGGYLAYIALFEQLSQNYKVITKCENSEEANLFNSELEKADYLVLIGNDGSQCLSPFIPDDVDEGIFKVLMEDRKLKLEPLE